MHEFPFVKIQLFLKAFVFPPTIFFIFLEEVFKFMYFWSLLKINKSKSRVACQYILVFGFEFKHSFLLQVGLKIKHAKPLCFLLFFIMFLVMIVLVLWGLINSFAAFHDKNIVILFQQEIYFHLALVNGLQIALNFVEVCGDIDSVLTGLRVIGISVRIRDFEFIKELVDVFRNVCFTLVFGDAFYYNGVLFYLFTRDILLNTLLILYHFFDDLFKTEFIFTRMIMYILLVNFLTLFAKKVDLHMPHCNKQYINHKY